MSEATTSPSGIPIISGARVPVCARCAHGHRIEVADPHVDDRFVTFDAACGECGCTAADADYDVHRSILAHTVNLTGSPDDHSACYIIEPGIVVHDHNHSDPPDRFDDDEYTRLGVHPPPRIRRSLQRPQRTVRGLRDRICANGSNVAKPWPLGSTMAVPTSGAGPGRARALSPLWLVSLVKSLCLRPLRRCSSCGCTDLRACPEGCWWVARNLCSECVLIEASR